MIQNSEGLLDNKIIIPENLKDFAQVSCDLRVIEMNRIIGGTIMEEDKMIQNYLDVDFEFDVTGFDKKVWHLKHGYVYSLTFSANVNIPLDRVGFVVHKSTLLRCGAFIISGLYDPGFQSQLGATLFCQSEELWIHKNAKIATFYTISCEKAPKYSGSYQGDNDRK